VRAQGGCFLLGRVFVHRKDLGPTDCHQKHEKTPDGYQGGP
jgi:hypothetical protein